MFCGIPAKQVSLFFFKKYILSRKHQQAPSSVFFFSFVFWEAPIELGDAYFEQCHFGVLDGVHVKYGLEGDLRWIVSGLVSTLMTFSHKTPILTRTTHDAPPTLLGVYQQKQVDTFSRTQPLKHTWKVCLRGITATSPHLLLSRPPASYWWFVRAEKLRQFTPGITEK